MKGFQLTFLTLQDRRHGGRLLSEWLIQAAQALGIRGATVITAAEGFGHDRRLHSRHFFELTDQPVEITMIISENEVERLFTRLREEKVNVFYVKAPIEFGRLGEVDEPQRHP
jgi:PII-like signaling protein